MHPILAHYRRGFNLDRYLYGARNRYILPGDLDNTGLNLMQST